MPSLSSKPLWVLSYVQPQMGTEGVPRDQDKRTVAETGCRPLSLQAPAPTGRGCRLGRLWQEESQSPFVVLFNHADTGRLTVTIQFKKSKETGVQRH